MEQYHFITIAENPFFYRQWYNSGVTTLSDILDEGNFLSFAEFRKKYKIKANFLLYFGLCNAILKYWKEALNRDLENESVTTGQSATHPLNVSFWTCQQARLLFVSKTFQKPTSKARVTKAGFTDQSSIVKEQITHRVTKHSNIRELLDTH